MITNELLAFIKEALSKGTSEYDIKKTLLDNGGWNESDVQEAFDAIGLYSKTYQGAVSKAFFGSADPDVGRQSPRVQEAASLQAKPESYSLSSQPNALNMRERMSAEVRSERAFPPFPASSPSSVAAGAPVLSPQSSQEQPASHANIALPGVGDAFAAVRSIAAEKTEPSIPSAVFPRTPEIRPVAAMPDNNLFLQSFAANTGKRAAFTPGNSRGEIVLPAAQKKSHWFLNFFLFVFFFLVMFGGGAFAYIKGYIPGVSLPFLDGIAEKFSNVLFLESPFGKESETLKNMGTETGISQNNFFVPETETSEQEPPIAASGAGAYYHDRVLISLPLGSPVTVTTLASTVAGELRGRVDSCTYSIGNNGCVIITTAKNESELQKIILNLKKDTRIKGAEAVSLP